MKSMFAAPALNGAGGDMLGGFLIRAMKSAGLDPEQLVGFTQSILAEFHRLNAQLEAQGAALAHLTTGLEELHAKTDAAQSGAAEELRSILRATSPEAAAMMHDAAVQVAAAERGVPLLGDRSAEMMASDLAAAGFKQ